MALWSRNLLSILNMDKRLRLTLGADAATKLDACASHLGLPTESGYSSIIEQVADAFLRHSQDLMVPLAKRRGSLGGAKRDLMSEPALAGLGWNLTELKFRAIPECDPNDVQAALVSLPMALRQLVMLVPDSPRSVASLSRDVFVALLLEGLTAHTDGHYEVLKKELSMVDSMASSYFEAVSQQRGLERLSSEFETSCPNLQRVFSDLVIGPHTAANTQHTEGVKLEWALILASALGKVRNKRRCGFAEPLYVLWKSLGVPIEAINILANLGLSLSATDGASKMRAIVDCERSKLLKILGKCNANLSSCAVFDNIDFSLGTKSFIKSEVDIRTRTLHVTAASVVFFRNAPAPLLAEVQERPETLPLSRMFADSDCQHRISAEVCVTLHRVLHSYGKAFLGCGTVEAAEAMVDCGSIMRSSRQAFPVYWLEEGKVDHMYQFVNDVLGKYSKSSRVHFVGDCYSLHKLLAVRELLNGENVGERLDPENSKMILVPGWFHLYWNVFLGLLFQTDHDLLVQMVEIAGLPNVRLSATIATCFNDMDHLVTILYPVVCVRLFAFFRDTVAPSLGLSLKTLAEKEVLLRFTLFITQSVQALGEEDRPILEWQRLCRVVLLLSVYRSLRMAIATENHAHMVDVLYLSVSLVCQGSFTQYRKVIIESVAHFERSTAQEREIYKLCFTGSYSGGHLGGYALDAIREFDNKCTKESLRRSHRSEGDLAPELELTEQQRDIRRVFSSAFPALNTGSRGSVPDLPPCQEVLGFAERAQWPKMLDELGEEPKKAQMPIFDNAAHANKVKDTLRSLHRETQFI